MVVLEDSDLVARGRDRRSGHATACTAAGLRMGASEVAGRRRLAALLAVLCLLLGACGSDEEETDGGGESAGSRDCLKLWNDDADASLKSLAGLSNDPKADVLTGSYGGKKFKSEIFDVSTTGTGDDLTVSPGDCVVTQVGDAGVLFVFVNSKDEKGAQAWHRLLESGKHPLAKPSGRKDLLKDPVRARIEGAGAEGRLERKG